MAFSGVDRVLDETKLQLCYPRHYLYMTETAFYAEECQKPLMKPTGNLVDGSGFQQAGAKIVAAFMEKVYFVKMSGHVVIQQKQSD